MPQVLSQIELLRELQPVAETNLERHLTLAKPWNPHDYIPWSDGKNFAMLGGQDWSPEQSSLSKVAKAAMVTNLLTEDNLPSYHRGLAENFSMDGAWGTWVGRWTAEENRHGIAMRDYLVVTRSVDPVALEQARMEHMTVGIDSPMEGANLLHGVAYVTFQELATRVSHRNTGKACNDPIADALLARIAADENLHMIFYRNMCSAAIELAPDQTMKAIADVVMNFQMPGLNQPDFRRNAVLIAKYGIYDLRQHLDEVIMPVLRKWDIFERTDFGPEGEKLREMVADYLADLEKQAVRFEESRDRALARDRERGEAIAV
ncbi:MULTISPECIES: acyl-ACP desaturase [unclassified Rhodococcus (in: high G+C Gram-positive bacteria)]|jgi:acyl-[acyl-carrier-protein] desaturase|uniref:acyl-ACP desaturase n=1 Tax=unclassified Rhodococcus (in: high G+C Gram-positive bacteria) TaxID=192944 RepID=UPI000487CF94|nr:MULTISPECIES: acyl-ACP desaturase [unclassified Rhodococcus (in: high G+C Gram-positive bacteria)]KQU39320.1 acyl-ACP desaturase [Rhodococcus sp. Leaf225]KQU43756.1 acyl-ACP desaturase [Rhodococcus sp. Leaf258]MBY6677485.1 acyl-ACP desaturase [Rhodococcus sp. BP-332]MBY6683677.1 acyl-ACP desaturase [Rhodococcus sp. BP-316]MBY6684486.1 acyl-ACP desaturase [Rhodococcus sp. BP-288]